MRDKQVGPVTAAIRSMRGSLGNPREPELINTAGDIIGVFSVGVKRFSRPTAKRRTVVPIGIIEVGPYGCRANVCGGDLGVFRTAAEAEAAILARSSLKPHNANWQNSAFAVTQ